jgi:hypothetical protein
MPAPVVNKSQTFYGVAGSALTATMALVSGGPVTWSAVGLPSGLTLDANSGALSGSPVTATNNLVVPITATNADGSDTVSAVFIIEWPNPVSRVKLVKYQFSNTGPTNDVTLYGDYHLYARWTGVGKIPKGIQWEGNSDGLRFYGVAGEAGTFTAEFEGPYPPNFSSTTTIGGSNGDPVDCFNSYPLAKGATAKITVEKFTVRFTVTELGTPNVTIDGFQFVGWRDFGQVYASLMRGPFMARRSGWGSSKRVVSSLVKKLTTSSTSAIAPVRAGLAVGDGGNLMWSSSSPREATITSPVSVPSGSVLGGKQVIRLAASGWSTNDYAIVRCSDDSLAAWGDFSTGLIPGKSNANEPYAFDTSGALSGKTVMELQAYPNYALMLCSDGSLFKWGRGLNAVDRYDNNPVPELLIGNISVFAYNPSEQVLVYATTGNVINFKVAPSNGFTTDTIIESGKGLLSGKTVTQLVYGTIAINNTLFRGVYALCSDGTIFFCKTLTDHATSTRTHEWSAVANDGALTGKTPVKMFSAVHGGGTPLRIFILCSDGTVAVRGYGGYGEAGTGATNFSNYGVWANVPLSGALSGKTVTSIATGFMHTLFLTSDGRVCGVGGNYEGQLGNGSTGSFTSTPVAVSTAGVLSGKVITQIAANVKASYAVATTGEVYSWGRNDSGQLGAGLALNGSSNIPVRVADGTGFVTIQPEVPTVVNNLELTVDDIEASDWQITEQTDFYPEHKRLKISSAQRQEIVPETSTQFARLIGRPFDGSTYRTAVNGDFPLKAFSNSFGEFITGENFEGDLEIEFFTTLNGVVVERPLATFGLGLFTQISTNETLDFRKPLPASGLTYDAFIGMGATDGGTLRTTLVDPYVRHVVYHIFCGALPDGEVKAHLKIQIKK